MPPSPGIACVCATPTKSDFHLIVLAGISSERDLYQDSMAITDPGVILSPCLKVVQKIMVLILLPLRGT